MLHHPVAGANHPRQRRPIHGFDPAPAETVKAAGEPRRYRMVLLRDLHVSVRHVSPVRRAEHTVQPRHASKPDQRAAGFHEVREQRPLRRRQRHMPGKQYHAISINSVQGTFDLVERNARVREDFTNVNPAVISGPVRRRLSIRIDHHAQRKVHR